MRELAATYQMEPCDKLKLLFEYHHFWLDSRTAPWNTALGTTYGRSREGNAGRDAGDEIDFTATYKVNKNMQCEAGAAYFFPGNWPEKQGRDRPPHSCSFRLSSSSDPLGVVPSRLQRRDAQG